MYICLQFDRENLNFIVGMAKPWNISHAVSWLNPYIVLDWSELLTLEDPEIRIYFFNNRLTSHLYFKRKYSTRPINKVFELDECCTFSYHTRITIFAFR